MVYIWKFVFSTSIFFASFGALAAKAWKPLDLPGVDRAWSQDKTARKLITLVNSKTESVVSFKEASNQEIASGIIGMRFLTLKTLGFENIQVSEFNIEKRQDASFVISMSGHYETPARQKVYFFERQTYRGQDFSQLSFLLRSAQLSRAEKAAAVKTLDSFAKSLQREPASAEENKKTEAQAICENCLESDLGFDEIKHQAEMLKGTVETKIPPAENCTASKTLIDPKQKSILQEKKDWLKKVGLGEETDNPAIIAGRSAVTCIYGVGKGIYGSLKDLVHAVPTLLGWTWKGLKAAKNGIQNADYKALMNKFSPQNIYQKGKAAIKVTAESVTNAYDKSSKSLFDSYKAGGTTGAVAAVAQAAYETSPHRVVGRFLASVGAKIAEAIGNEWGAFKCLDPETMSQMVCQVAAYIMTDIYSGNLIISGLSKTVKLKEAITLVKAGIFRDKKAQQLIKDAEKIDLTPKKETFEDLEKTVQALKQVDKVDPEIVRASEGALHSAQKISLDAAEKEILDLSLVKTAMEEAKATGQTDALETLKKAYDGIREAAGGENKISKAGIKSWEEKVKKEKPELTDGQITRARQCLFGGAK